MVLQQQEVVSQEPVGRTGEQTIAVAELVILESAVFGLIHRDHGTALSVQPTKEVPVGDGPRRKAGISGFGRERRWIIPKEVTRQSISLIVELRIGRHAQDQLPVSVEQLSHQAKKTDTILHVLEHVQKNDRVKSSPCLDEITDIAEAQTLPNVFDLAENATRLVDLIGRIVQADHIQTAQPCISGEWPDATSEVEGAAR